MAEWNRQGYGRFGPAVARGDLTAVDQGLRAYMIQVYNYMGLGLLITGVAAYLVFAMAVTNDPSGAAGRVRDGLFLTNFGYALFMSPLKWVVILAPLAIVFLFGFRINRMSVGAAQATFWTFAALIGLSLS